MTDPDTLSPPSSDGEPLDLDVRYRADAIEIEVARPGAAKVSVPATVAAVRAIVSSEAATAWHLAAEHPPAGLDPTIEEIATGLGLVVERELLQLRRPLPVAEDHPIAVGAPTLAVRPFRPGVDDAAWIDVNNRAFATHPDQGRETRETLADHMAEDWFDADGFLVADDLDRPQSLSGFCWTKVHPATATDPALGEIYVIGVDPAHQGEGLGAAFVLAGLAHLCSKGIGTANLYVEANNRAALALYDRLGFAAHQRRRVYGR